MYSIEFKLLHNRYSESLFLVIKYSMTNYNAFSFTFIMIFLYLIYEYKLQYSLLLYEWAEEYL